MPEFGRDLLSVVCLPFHHLVIECVGQELNLHSLGAGGLQPLGLASAQPTRLHVNAFLVT